MSYTITQKGEPLSASLYTIDDDNKIFFSLEDNLELDFTGLSGWSFNIHGCGWCAVSAGDGCFLSAGHHGNFIFGTSGTFEAGWASTFTTEASCSFKIRGHKNHFHTGDWCYFDCFTDNDFVHIGEHCVNCQAPS